MIDIQIEMFAAPVARPFLDYVIRPIHYADAMDLVVKYHYLHRRAPCSVAFGLFRGHDVRGVVCYGTPSSAPLRSGLAGPDNACNVAELTRLWVCDSVPRNGESYLIGNTVRLCKKQYVVSYAEADRGHVGTVYQATNWLYTGLSAMRTNWVVDGLDLHCQTLADRYDAATIREKYGERFSVEPRPRKHRYVFLNARGNRRRQLLRDLRYSVMPYPKRKEAT